MQTFPPVEADLILAQAIKLKQTHILKYDKLEIKYSADDLKTNGTKAEDKHTPPKEEKVDAKKEDAKANTSTKKKEVYNPLVLLGSDQKEHKERRDSKVMDSGSKQKDDKAILFSSDLMNNLGQMEKFKSNSVFNPLDNANRITDLASARKVIQSSITSLVAEEYVNK